MQPTAGRFLRAALMLDVRQLQQSDNKMRGESRLLASAMRRQFRHAPRRRFRAWSDPATNVLDCVLSLNRQYNPFVKPRLETFSTRHPKMMGLSSLRHLIRRYKSPGAFSVDE